MEVDFDKYDLWLWTGGTYTKKGYYIPVCITVIKNIEMYNNFKKTHSEEEIIINKLFLKG
jgi:hypothetical protein